MSALLIGSFISAFATVVGAIPILFFRKISHLWRDILIAFTAGVMVYASTFSLIPQTSSLGTVWEVVLGVLFGALLLQFIISLIPQTNHVDPFSDANPIHQIGTGAYIIVIGLTLHNIPEGFAVGVSYANQADSSLGSIIALAIGIQNAPEGLIIALFFAKHFSKMAVIGIVALTAIIEPISALVGYYLVNVVNPLLPVSLSVAAGAMLYLVYRELIPESHGDGHEQSATFAFIFGILVMLVIDSVL